MSATEEFEPNHSDRVVCLHINHDGSKLLTGSIDHRIKVWSVSSTQKRTLVETFSAHDADIRDAKWLHPSTGTHLGTVGNDLKFHLWGEDVAQAPNSGRRFRRLCTINSPTRVPFVSLDFRNIDNVYTYLAIVDRQGLLSIYEPTNPDEFKEWTLVDRWNVAVPVPARGEQTSFRVRWDQNFMPLPYVCSVNEDKKQLSLVVTAGNEVKIYRGVTPDGRHDDNDIGGSDGEASHRLVFYEAAKLPVHPALIRDVQWAPFNVRGTDLFATACKDGGVRIFEMSVSEPFDAGFSGRRGGTDAHAAKTEADSASIGSKQNKAPQTPRQYQPQSSTLTSAITGGRQQALAQGQSSTSHKTKNSNGDTTNLAAQAQAGGVGGQSNTTFGPISPANTATTSSTTRYTAPRNTYSFPYAHSISLIANLEHAHDDAWSVSWDPNGQILISGGADGSTKIWRRSVLDVDLAGFDGNGNGDGTSSGAGVGAGGPGRWMLFADQAVSLGDELDDGDGDDDEGE